MHITQLLTSPVYWVVIILCIGYLFLLRDEKGCFIFLGRIYSIIHVCIFITAILLYLFG
jgi:ABC-type Na+ efflux pump permease subunit